MFATPYAEGCAFIRSDQSMDRPDLQIHFSSVIVDNHLRTIHLKNGLSCHVCVLRPKSRGSVGLTDAQPKSKPRIDPQYLSDPDDLKLLMKGCGRLKKTNAADALTPWRGKHCMIVAVVMRG